jgi:acyl dehydratase
VVDDRYDWRDAVIYALGIGATIEELEFLSEVHGPKVYPTFGLTLGGESILRLLEAMDLEVERSIHHAQEIFVVGKFPPRATVRVVAQALARYNFSGKLGVVLRTSVGLSSGKDLLHAYWYLLFPKRSGAGYLPWAGRDQPRPGRTVQFETQEVVGETQAYLYRLSGDLNQVHVDTAAANELGFERPILHGLSTYGYVLRAAQRIGRATCSGAVSYASAVFARPVFPGDTLVIRGARLDSSASLAVFTARTAKPVLVNVTAEFESV